MPGVVQTLLVLLLLAAALVVGVRWGRAQERRRANDPVYGAFAAGFRAGHVQGWKDGEAARKQPTAPEAPQPAAPAPAAPHPTAAPAPAPASPQPWPTPAPTVGPRQDQPHPPAQ